MKKEAKGKRKIGHAGRRIPIEVFSTRHWPVRMKIPSGTVHDDHRTCRVCTPLSSRELDLGALFTAVYQELAA
jgi:hypothetical protein